MQVLEELAILRALANPTANKWKRKNNEHAVVAEMDQYAAPWDRLHPMCGRVIPGKLRGLLGCGGKRVAKIQIMSFLRQLAGDGVLRRQLEFLIPVGNGMDGVVCFVGLCGKRGRHWSAISVISRRSGLRPRSHCLPLGS